ncbi:hypothetical protein WA171_000949, partial [Blastocystis sp. BT1]
MSESQVSEINATDTPTTDTMSPLLTVPVSERPVRFKPKHHLFTRLLLPHERVAENPPEDKPKKHHRGYKRHSKEILRDIRFAKSIVDSINETSHSIVFDDLEKMVLNDEEVISHEDLSLQAREVIANEMEPVQYCEKKWNPSVEPVNADVFCVSEEDIESILAGELRLPYPIENEDAFQSIQDQLDTSIVRNLPPEFWGSRFYLDSSTALTCSPVQTLPPAYDDLLQKLVCIANRKEPRIMQVVHTRFSRKRSNRYLNELCSSFSTIVKPSILKKALKRMHEISDSLYTISSDKRSK